MRLSTSPARSVSCILLICAYWFAETAAAQPRVDFARDIRPILKEHCVECHGPSQQMAGLRLDRRRDAIPNRVGANGVRIIPGNSTGSRLYQRVSAEQGKQMPPTGPLAKDQIDRIKAWIDEGADWPDSVSGETSTSSPDSVVVSISNLLRNGGHRDFLRAITDNPEAVNAKGESGWTPLMYAVLYGDADLVRLLLEKGANPNLQNDAGGSALMYATGDVDITKLLLDHGANPNFRSGEGRTALAIACSRAGSSAIVKLLLAHGADLKSAPPGRSILSLSASTRDPELLQLLLDSGAEKNPLPFTNTIGCAKCFHVLSKVAEPRDLSSALDMAALMGDTSLVNSLLERGAKPSPFLLFSVAMSPRPASPEVIRNMIRNGAKPDNDLRLGFTLVDFAKRQGNALLVRISIENGAKENNSPPVADAPRAITSNSPRAAIGKSLPVLQRSDAAFLRKAGCVSCHNNSLTAMALASVRGRGLSIDERLSRETMARTAAYLRENRERALENEGLPGAADTVSYILVGMAAAKYPGDSTTEIWAQYLKNIQCPDGHWASVRIRPPLESSDFETTAASIRALETYGRPAQRPLYAAVVMRADRWLEANPPLETADHVFKIFGLMWGGGDRGAIQNTARALLALQRPDGGWGQRESLPSDAYATGQALAALRESGLITAASRPYRRGVQYLLNSQAEDGSWHVRTRSPTIQPYFDSEFPYARDQFISAAATNWAVMALSSAAFQR